MPVISGGNVLAPGNILQQSILFTETATGTSFVGSVVVPPGALVLDVIVHQIALWSADTSASMKIGDTEAGGSPDEDGSSRTPTGSN